MTYSEVWLRRFMSCGPPSPISSGGPGHLGPAWGGEVGGSCRAVPPGVEVELIKVNTPRRGVTLGCAGEPKSRTYD